MKTSKSCTSCAKKDKEIRRLGRLRVIGWRTDESYLTVDMLNIKC